MTAQNIHHRINKLTMRVQASDPGRALNLRKRLREQWADILPELERGFAEIDDGQSWLHIPRLEITLHHGNADSLAGELPELLRTALRETLQRNGLSRARVHAGNIDAAIAAASADSDSMAAAMQAEDVDEYGLLLDYLESGRLPWYLTTDATALQRLGKAAAEHSQRLYAYLLERGGVYRYFRACRLLDIDRIEQLLELHLEAARVTTPIGNATIIRLMRHLLYDTGKPAAGYRGLMLVALLLARLRDPDEAATSMQMLLTEEQKISPAEWRAIAGPISTRSESPTLLSVHLAPLVQTAVLDESGFEPAAPAMQTGGTGQVNAQAALKISAGTAAVSRQPETSRIEDKHADTAEQTRTVMFTGVILLHPYLPRFLKACGIEAEAGALPVAALGRAAALLHYLVTGNDEPEEFQLELFKILLGMTPEAPLPVAAGMLNDDDKAEADALLQSLLGHWSALKNTSLPGLRASFLNRSGYLKKTDTGWLLTVERCGYDVLLDYFPFSFSMVRLPWMREPIHVYW